MSITGKERKGIGRARISRNKKKKEGKRTGTGSVQEAEAAESEWGSQETTAGSSSSSAAQKSTKEMEQHRRDIHTVLQMHGISMDEE